MLGKLIKHEFRATYRLFLSVYAVLIGMTLLTLLSLKLSSCNTVVTNMFGGICTIGLCVSMIALPFITLIYIGYRFYKNLFTDEGYLMFTLPVRKHNLIFSKYIVSIVWVTGTVGAILLSLALLTLGSTDISQFVDAFNKILSESNNLIFGENTGVLSAVIFYSITNILYIVAFIYMALSFGQLIIPKHKIIGAILAYFVLQIISQIISSVVLGAYHVTGSINFTSDTVPVSIFFVMGVIMLVLTIAWLFFTNLICEKKLNLS